MYQVPCAGTWPQISRCHMLCVSWGEMWAKEVSLKRVFEMQFRNAYFRPVVHPIQELWPKPGRFWHSHVYEMPTKVFLNRSSAQPAPEPASSNFKQDLFGKAFAEQFSADQMERAIIHTTGGLHSFYLWLLAQKTFCLPPFIFHPDYSENFYLSFFLYFFHSFYPSLLWPLVHKTFSAC